MKATTRRAVLGTIAGCAAAGGLSALFGPLRAAPPASLRLPETTMRLTRVLARGLGETAVITVRRSWDVQFAQQGRGIVVTGRQVAASVDAPPHLARLAQLEEQRDASAMLPIMLSDVGMIISPGIEPGSALAPSDAVSDALRAAEAMIARQPVPADEREKYRFYLAQVHQSGASLLDSLPDDLFFPAGAPVARTENISLPDGLTGRFALRYRSEPQADAPWLARAERQIETEVAGLTRSASESWTLTAA
jgi:hypothetical protein